jgi:hypothetical protein
MLTEVRMYVIDPSFPTTSSPISRRLPSPRLMHGRLMSDYEVTLVNDNSMPLLGAYRALLTVSSVRLPSHPTGHTPKHN